MIINELELLKETKNDEAYLRDNYGKLRERYPDKFIAIKDGNVIAEGSNMSVVLAKLKKEKENSALITIEFIHKKGTILIL